MGVEADKRTSAGDRRRALVAAMARSCAERGYEETAVEDLLAATGLSRGDFELHFADKEQCAMAAVDAILSDGMSAVSIAYSADTSERDSALMALRLLLRLFAERPAFAGLAFIDSRQAMPSGGRERYEAGFAILTAMLDRLRADSDGGERLPPLTARAAIGGGEALVRRRLATGRGSELPATLPDLVYSATVPFLGQEEALRLVRDSRVLLRAEEEFVEEEGGG